MKEKEAIEKGIDIKALQAEQKKLAKALSIKDAFDFGNATRFGAVHTQILEKTKEILASTAVLDENLEVVEEKYVIRPIKFPYIPSYRAYRELPIMLVVYSKLEEQPDLVFIEAHGIAHPRGLGLASHLGVSIQKPTIGIAKNVLVGKEKKGKVTIGNKNVAQTLVTKKGAKAVYVSPGHMISMATAVEMTKHCIKEPHKLPEPIVMARKVAERVIKELGK